MVCVLSSRTGRELQRYNDMGFRQVVGCIPYRYKVDRNGNVTDELEVLVISSSKKSQVWMFPKGGWELDESEESAACRESLEEAGVLGVVERELGRWSFISKRYGTCYEGSMYPLFVKEQLDLWPEKNIRRRTWMSAAEARVECVHDWMKEALDRLVERVMPPDQLNEYHILH